MNSLVKAQEEGAQELADAYKMRAELLRYCERLGDLPPLEVADYERLRTVLRGLRPEIYTDEKLSAGHGAALRRTHAAIATHLRSAGLRDASRVFARRARKAVSASSPGYERDLRAVLSQAFELDESSACSRAYLALFYSQWIYDLEPLASLKIAGLPTPGATRPGPGKVRSVGRRGWIGLGRAKDAAELAAILAKLENPEEPGSSEETAATARPDEVRWILDLRGDRVWSEPERGLIAASLERGWKAGKIEEIWVGGEPAAQGNLGVFASRPAWPVRRLCRKDPGLGEGKVIAFLTITCEGGRLDLAPRAPSRAGEDEGEFLKAQAALWDWEEEPFKRDEAPAPSAGAGTPSSSRESVGSLNDG